MNKAYGIWCGSGWLRTADGALFHSWSPNAMQAIINEDRRTNETVREIGPNGNPVELDTDEKQVRPQSDKMVRPQSDKAVRLREDK